MRPTELAASYSPPRLRRIPATGDLICVWNQVSREEIRRGYRRGRLSCAISRDSGESWEHFRTIEVSAGLADVDQIAPEHPIIPVIGLPEVGALPDDFATFDYPNVCFAGDRVFLIYHRSWVDSGPEARQARTLGERGRGRGRQAAGDGDPQLSARLVLRLTGQAPGPRTGPPRRPPALRRAAARVAAALLSILLSGVIFLQFLDLAATGVELWTGMHALLASVATYLLGLGELIAVLTIWFAYGRAAREGRLRTALLKVTLWQGLAALAYLPARLAGVPPAGTLLRRPLSSTRSGSWTCCTGSWELDPGGDRRRRALAPPDVLNYTAGRQWTRAPALR